MSIRMLLGSVRVVRVPAGPNYFGNICNPQAALLSTRQKRFYAKKIGKPASQVDCVQNTYQTKGRMVQEYPSSAAHLPINDPYRIKLPEITVPPLPDPNAKPMIDCARTKGPCSGDKPPPPEQPPPKPAGKFPWFIPLGVAGFFAFVGLLYKYYLYLLRKSQSEETKIIWRPRPKRKYPMYEKDLPACVQYLIVGTGAAAWAAYRAIIDHDNTAKVFFITKEDSYPYQRPPLSKHMLWNLEPPDLRQLDYVEDGVRKSCYYAECSKFVDPMKFYRMLVGPAVSVALGWCVSRVDADDHAVFVTTESGEQPIYYERCLLATGSKHENLPIFSKAPKTVRDRVCRLRTIRDLEIAHRKIHEAKHITVIGAGALGTEIAYYLGRMEKELRPPPHDSDYKAPEIAHIYKDKGVLGGIIPEYLGEWAAERLKCEKVKVYPKTQVYDAFEARDGKLELTLSNGESIKTDYVFLCIGSKPRDEIAELSYLELDPTNGGIVVNTELEARTHFYVAGDCASVYSQWKNQRLRMDHDNTAADMGYIAGANMAGSWTPFNLEQNYWIQLGHDLELEVVGEVGACMPTVGLFKPCFEKKSEKVQEYERRIGEYSKPCYKQTEEYRDRYKRGMIFYLRDEVVVGMAFWNFPPIEDRFEVATEMLRAKPTYEDIDLLAELLGFPNVKCVVLPEDKVQKAEVCLKASKWTDDAEM